MGNRYEPEVNFRRCYDCDFVTTSSWEFAEHLSLTGHKRPSIVKQLLRGLKELSTPQLPPRSDLISTATLIVSACVGFVGVVVPIAIGTVGFYIVFEERAWVFVPLIIGGAIAIAGIAFCIVRLLIRFLTPADRERLEQLMNEFGEGTRYLPR